MLTHTQKKLLDFLIAAENGGSVPSYREMCAALGIGSTCSIHHTLQKLAERGFVELDRYSHRSVRVVRRLPSSPPAPRIGTVPLRFIPILSAHGSLPERAA